MNYKNGTFRDKNGRFIREFDVLKVFHFIGSRNKKHYMYKLATNREGYLFFHHLCSNDPTSGYDPRSQVDKESGLIPDTEIVQGHNPDYESKERKK